MKQFDGYDDAKKTAEFSAQGKLPAGAYVCKVLNVKYEEGKDGFSDRIVLQLDIDEGEYANYYAKQYENNPNEDKRWKGVTRIYVPNDDGSEKDGWTKKRFAQWTAAFEKSNNGFLWAWDETKLKGLIIGIVFGETGTVINGRNVVYTEPRFPVEVERVRQGKAPEAKFVKKNGYEDAPKAVDDEFMKAAESDEDYFQVWPIDADVNVDKDAEYNKLCETTDVNGNKAYFRRIKAKEAKTGAEAKMKMNLRKESWCLKNMGKSMLR